MTLNDVAAITNGTVLCCDQNLGRVVHYAGAADLMSDVLTLDRDGLVFLTGLVSEQTIRTAVVSDIHAILFVRGKRIPSSVVDLARQNDICVISSPYSMYRASGLLFQAGLPAVY